MEYTRAGPRQTKPGVPKLMGELVTGRNGVDNPNGGECRCVAFAPDESRLAWSSGHGKVVVIPWDKYKTCLYSDKSKDSKEYHLAGDQIILDCKFEVCSLAFGTATPESQLASNGLCYWQRIDNTRHLVLATAHHNGRMRIWDPYNGRLVLELMDHTKPVSCLAFAPDGSLRLVSGSDDGNVKVWDMSDDGNMFKTFTDHKCPVKALAWSPNSTLLCSVGNKRKAFIYDMKTYTMVRALKGHYNDILSVVFSPDGATIATASADTKVIVWDACTGEALKTLHHVSPPPGIIYISGSNDSQVTGVSFSPKGSQLASICSDGVIRYWNLIDGSDEDAEHSIQVNGEDAMLTCAYSPMGSILAVGHTSGNVLFYSTPTQVPSLLHMSRMTLRKKYGKVTNVKCFLIPKTLRPYLEYKDW